MTLPRGTHAWNYNEPVSLLTMRESSSRAGLKSRSKQASASSPLGFAWTLSSDLEAFRFSSEQNLRNRHCFMFARLTLFVAILQFDECFS